MAAARAWLLLIALLLLKEAAAKAWSPDEFPNPKVDVEACGRHGLESSICDPDGVMSKEGADAVEGVIKDIYAGSDPYARHDCGDTGLAGYEVAVALMRKMQLPPGTSPAERAEQFSRLVFESWGVGHAACDDGVLLLISVDDRQVYIRTGRGAERALPDGRLSSIIGGLRPLLRQHKYDQAVEQAVVDIGLGLAGWSGGGRSAVDWFAIAFFAVVLGLILLSVWKARTRRQQYRDCRTALDKLKQEQEALRKHEWSAPRSCPVCLEDFAPPPPGSGGSGGSVLEEAEDTQPSAPLLGGLPGQGAGPRPSSASGSDAERGSAGGLRRRSSGSAQAPGEGAAGAAGGARRPPVTLACGHTFCEPCIEAWLKNASTCPICRKPVAGGAAPPPPADSQEQRRRRRLGADLLDAELAFRLGVLHGRYPWFISPGMVDSWADETRRTGTFDWQGARDFQLRDPAVQRQHRQSGSSGFSTSFGGGSSSGGGGAGGSW